MVRPVMSDELRSVFVDAAPDNSQVLSLLYHFNESGNTLIVHELWV